jgi:hypothetical protein
LPWNSTGSGPHRALRAWIISVMRAPRWAIGTLLAVNSSSELCPPYHLDDVKNITLEISQHSCQAHL